MEIMRIDDHISAIDHMLYDVPGAGVSYVVQGEEVAIIETGTSLTAPHTLAGLEQLGIARDAVGHIICTHVHMDHAGGAGELAAALPRANVYLHSLTSDYLVDPEKIAKLEGSVRRAVGELLWPLHGTFRPVPAERMRPAETLHLDLGHDIVLDALVTPGHSPDHVAYFERRSGGMFVGDAASLSMPYYNLTFPVSPPPTYDLEVHLQTVEKLRTYDISRFYVTHTGPYNDVPGLLNLTSEMLQQLAELVQQALAKGDEDSVALALRWLPYDETDEGQAFVARNLGDMTVRGMQRYFKKRQQSA